MGKKAMRWAIVNGGGGVEVSRRRGERHSTSQEKQLDPIPGKPHRKEEDLCNLLWRTKVISGTVGVELSWGGRECSADGSRRAE